MRQQSGPHSPLCGAPPHPATPHKAAPANAPAKWSAQSPERRSASPNHSAQSRPRACTSKVVRTPRSEPKAILCAALRHTQPPRKNHPRPHEPGTHKRHHSPQNEPNAIPSTVRETTANHANHRKQSQTSPHSPPATVNFPLSLPSLSLAIRTLLRLDREFPTWHAKQTASPLSAHLCHSTHQACRSVNSEWRQV